jgi:hypothetical protein
MQMQLNWTPPMPTVQIGVPLPGANIESCFVYGCIVFLSVSLVERKVGGSNSPEEEKSKKLKQKKKKRA